MEAHTDGAISATEAHAILHPLYHQIAECCAVLAERAEGVVDRGSVATSRSSNTLGHSEHKATLRDASQGNDEATVVTVPPQQKPQAQKIGAENGTVPGTAD